MLRKWPEYARILFVNFGAAGAGLVSRNGICRGDEVSPSADSHWQSWTWMEMVSHWAILGSRWFTAIGHKIESTCMTVAESFGVVSTVSKLAIKLGKNARF